VAVPTTVRFITHERVKAAPATPQQFTGPRWSDSPKPVPPEFFGVTINSSTGKMPSFDVGAVRLWDSGTTWARVEPRRGSFEWSTLDRLVAGAKAAHVPVLFTFGATPSWASPDGPRAPYDDGSRASPPDDLRDWDTYVQAVAARYGNRIGAYELWNLAPSPLFFTGSPGLLARMTERASSIIRTRAPRATVVCPGMGDQWTPASRQFMLRFAQAGGYRYCDVASVKLHQRDFGDSPESVVRLADLIDNTMRQAGLLMRTWNTGTAYRIAVAKHLSEDQAVNYAVRFYLIGLFVRYERMYFYNWGGTKVPIVLQPVDGAPTTAALFMAELQRWLRGAQITQCGQGTSVGLPANVWQCRFLIPTDTGSAEPALIRWSESGRASMRLESGASEIRRLDGTTSAVRAGDSVQITERPILILYAAHPAAAR
jgi:hypothetical protein